MPLDLPYFDDLFSRAADSPIGRAFQRHVHWGYFATSGAVDDSDEGFQVAAEAMTQRVTMAARVRSGSRILDVGCGVGGTIAHLNERLSDCQLVGLNIDERQLVRARQLVQPGRGNSVGFVQGDACELPFDDGAFDVVTAVECIFHFPSRQRFFHQARRVLRPGGTLMVSDILIDGDKVDQMNAWVQHNASALGGFYGSSTSTSVTSSVYAELAASEGFTVLSDTDITAATMPTYPFLKRLYRDAGRPDGVKATAFIEEMSRRGFFQYRILSFEAKG